jgi:hypothetical protein
MILLTIEDIEEVRKVGEEYMAKQAKEDSRGSEKAKRRLDAMKHAPPRGIHGMKD